MQRRSVAAAGGETLHRHRRPSDKRFGRRGVICHRNVTMPFAYIVGSVQPACTTTTLKAAARSRLAETRRQQLTVVGGWRRRDCPNPTSDSDSAVVADGRLPIAVHHRSRHPQTDSDVQRRVTGSAHLQPPTRRVALNTAATSEVRRPPPRVTTVHRCCAARPAGSGGERGRCVSTQPASDGPPVGLRTQREGRQPHHHCCRPQTEAYACRQSLRADSSVAVSAGRLLARGHHSLHTTVGSARTRTAPVARRQTAAPKTAATTTRQGGRHRRSLSPTPLPRWRPACTPHAAVFQSASHNGSKHRRCVSHSPTVTSVVSATACRPIPSR